MVGRGPLWWFYSFLYETQDIYVNIHIGIQTIYVVIIYKFVIFNLAREVNSKAKVLKH